MLNTIIILTDFEEFYTVQITGKILSVSNKNVNIQTLRVENYSVIKAAFILYQISKFFENAIFVCVVDPYVGTKRRSVIVKRGKNFFIGPDNGIFSMLNAHIEQVVEIDEKKFKVGKTFHGRDIFAVIAGEILNGKEIDDFGKKNKSDKSKKIKTKIKTLNLKNRILYIDNFGNIITSIKNDKIKDNKKEIRVKINKKEIKTIYVKTFSDEKENFIVYKGSSGFLEIGKFMENAAEILNAKVGDKVKILKF